ncbi:putative cyclase [Phlegmacium glaucopus]|nr:putative cyclase [Phlegmacium glaucopus]
MVAGPQEHTKPTFIDLTLVLDSNRVQAYPGDHPFIFRQVLTMEANGHNIGSMSFGSVHVGTHLDAPFHFIANGKTIDQIPLSDLIGPALVVNLSGRELQPRQQISWADLSPWHAHMREGVIVLISTGWSERHWCTPQYYHHPYLTTDAAEGLVASGVRVIGLDTLGPDETPLDGVGGENGFKFHEIFLGAGGLIAENLTNLSALIEEEGTADGGGMWIVNLIPLNLHGSDGSPIRAFAHRA